MHSRFEKVKLHGNRSVNPNPLHPNRHNINEIPNKRHHIINENSNQRHHKINENPDQTNISSFNNIQTKQLNDFPISDKIQNYKFLWNSNLEPFKEGAENNWEPYDENNQQHLNINYNLFLKYHQSYQIQLLAPLYKYGVDFSKNRQFMIKDTNKIRPIKILKLDNLDKISNGKTSPKLQNKHKFYWQSNSDPWHKNQKIEWEAYNPNDQKVLEKAYQAYLLDKTNKYAYLKNYYVNFDKNNQINKDDFNKIRPIKIDKEQDLYMSSSDNFDINNISYLPKKHDNLPKDPKKIIPNHFQQNNIGNNNQNKIELNKSYNPCVNMNEKKQINNIIMDCIPAEEINQQKQQNHQINNDNLLSEQFNKKYAFVNQNANSKNNNHKEINYQNIVSKIAKINFNLFSEFKCIIRLEENLNFFPNGYNFNEKLENIKDFIIKEINNFLISHNLQFNTAILTSSINSIKNYKDFFEAIFKIYIFEDILYSKINDYMRNLKIKDLDIIKIFYLCLLATFEYYSKCNYNIFEKLKQKDMIIVYKYCYSDNSQHFLNQNNILENKVYIFNELLCTHFNPDCLKTKKKRNYFNQFFWEIKIPQTLIKFERNNFALIGKDFKDVNLLIKSGAIVEIKEIKLVNVENSGSKIYKISCIMKSFSLSSYLSVFTSMESNTHLNLCGNNLGMDTTSMNTLVETLKYNKSVKSLDLSFNKLGQNQMIIKNFNELLGYNNIKRIIVSYNDLSEEMMNNLEKLKTIDWFF